MDTRILLALFFLLTACAAQEQPLEIGAVIPLSGPAAGLGETLKESYEWKIEELQQEGWAIALTIEDSQSDPKAAVVAFRRLTEVEQIGIILAAQSGASMAVKPIAEEEGVLLLSTSAHPRITEGTRTVLRHSQTVSSDAEALGSHLQASGMRRISIVHQQDDWGVALKDALAQRLSGASVSAEAIDQQHTEFRTPLLKAIQSDPDAVVLVAVGPAAGTLVQQLKELGYGGAIYSSVGLVLTPDAIIAAGDHLEGTYYETYVPNQQFEQDYRMRFGRHPPALGFVGYTDIELLAHAITETNSTDPRTLASFIRGMGRFEGRYENVTITPEGDILIPVAIRKWE